MRLQIIQNRPKSLSRRKLEACLVMKLLVNYKLIFIFSISSIFSSFFLVFSFFFIIIFFSLLRLFLFFFFLFFFFIFSFFLSTSHHHHPHHHTTTTTPPPPPLQSLVTTTVRKVYVLRPLGFIQRTLTDLSLKFLTPDFKVKVCAIDFVVLTALMWRNHLNTLVSLDQSHQAAFWLS